MIRGAGLLVLGFSEAQPVLYVGNPSLDAGEDAFDDGLRWIKVSSGDWKIFGLEFPAERANGHPLQNLVLRKAVSAIVDAFRSETSFHRILLRIIYHYLYYNYFALNCKCGRRDFMVKFV